MFLRQFSVISEARMGHLFAIATIFVSLALMSACAETAKKDQPVEDGPGPESDPLEQLAVQEHVRRAIDLLNAGQVELARRHLELTLLQEPRSPMARDLVHQIDLDPGDYFFSLFNTKNLEETTRVVQQGELLGQIAYEAYGDSLKFFVLAKYNNIAIPNDVTAGQVLRVPIPSGGARVEVSRPVSPVDVGADAIDTADNTVARGRAQLAQGDYRACVATLEGRAAPGSDAEATLSECQLADARSAIEEGRNVAAKTQLEQVLARDPENAEARTLMATVATGLNHEISADLTAQGADASAAGELERAYDYYSRAVSMDSSNAEARAGQDKVGATLVSRYHSDALTYRTQGNYCDAVAKWNEALAIAPDHVACSSNRDKTQRVIQTLGIECP